jgi:hypothetical protein
MQVDLSKSLARSARSQILSRACEHNPATKPAQPRPPNQHNQTSMAAAAAHPEEGYTDNYDTFRDDFYGTTEPERTARQHPVLSAEHGHEGWRVSANHRGLGAAVRALHERQVQGPVARDREPDVQRGRVFLLPRKEARQEVRREAHGGDCAHQAAGAGPRRRGAQRTTPSSSRRSRSARGCSRCRRTSPATTRSSPG